MIKKYDFMLNRGRSGRVMANDDIDYNFERPRFGFYWWFWLPRIKWNGGKFGRDACVDFNVMWLCFWVGFVA